MRSLSIQCGAVRPQGRGLRAIVPLLARVAAVAGFAFAGWIALSALADTAFADGPEPRPQAVHDAVFGDGGPVSDELPALRRLSPGQGRGAAESLSGDLREAGADPVTYLGSRERDVLDGKDRAVRRIEELAAAAGVPRLPAPEVRPDRPVIGGLVHQMTGPEQAAPADPGEPPAADAEVGHAPEKGEPATARTGRTAAPVTFAGAAQSDDGDGHCAACRGGDRAPVEDPALPSAPDGPRNAGSGGGHPFVPLADLLTRQYPAAPAAADAGTFHRTALSDVAAPGGPSVVPD